MAVNQNTSDEKLEKGLIYLLGIGSTFMPFFFFLSPILAFLILGMYELIKNMDKSRLKRILIFAVTAVFLLGVIPVVDYLSTSFLSLFLGLVIYRILSSNRIIGLVAAYIVSLITAITFSLGLISLIVWSEYYISLGEIIMDIQKNWLSVPVLIFIMLIAPLIGISIGRYRKNYLFGYTVAFEIVLAVYWINFTLNFQMFG